MHFYSIAAVLRRLGHRVDDETTALDLGLDGMSG
jgi:hypothetical protein